ncbi:MAG: hypothetical protein HQ595_02680 [Candidatus Omnitrophica bacterium]|nr:hypothetical protein [Candidatus Omnitrophota bacterium]
MKTRMLICFFIFCLMFSASGCEAFRKKFVRKSSKKEKAIRVVTQTKEYLPEASREERYKNYFLFWRSWHDELINALNAQDRNRKKQVFTAKKIVENLEQIRELLLPEGQKQLDPFLLEQKDIAKQLDAFRLNRAQVLRIKSLLEKNKRRIQEGFSYRHIQEYLIR